MEALEKCDKSAHLVEGSKIYNDYLVLRNVGVPFPAESIAFWTGLLAMQNVAGVTGDMLELGVEHGGTAFLSVCALRDDEIQVLIDIKRSEKFDDKYTMLPNNKASAVRFYETGTQSPDTAEVLNRNFRFIHIDAGHTYEAVKKDMIRYAGLLKEKGLLCCDDFFTIRWPEVTLAILDTFEEKGLVPLFLVNRKIYFCKQQDYLWWVDLFNKNLKIFNVFGVLTTWETTVKNFPSISARVQVKANIGRLPI